MSRVTVDLPLVPVIEIDGHPSVGVADPRGRRRARAAIRASQRSTTRCLGAGQADPPAAARRGATQVHGRLRDRRARSAPAQGQVTIHRPMSDGAVDLDCPLVLAVVGAQPAGPGDEVGDVVRPSWAGTSGRGGRACRRRRPGAPPAASGRRRPRP